MANLTVNGTIEGKDAFKASGGKEPTMYGKLEVILERGQDPQKIEAGDINISDLGNVSLLVLKTKDEKYDADIKYKVNIDGDTEADEAKLNSTKILWLSLDNKKPLPLVKGYKQIKKSRTLAGR